MTEKNDDTTRRRFLQATGAAAAAAALAGCSSSGGGNSSNNSSGGSGGGGSNASSSGDNGGNESTDTQQNVKADPSKTLRRTLEGTITSLDPIAQADTASGEVIMQMFDTLMNYPNGNANVEQLLAKSHSVSQDSTTYTFKLRDATFHNGKTVTAKDFVYSFERLASSSNSQRASFILDTLGVTHKTDSDDNYVPGSMGVTAKNEKTLVIEIDQPFHAALQILAYTSFSPVPEGIVGDVEGYSGEMPYQKFARNPVGSGPFEFKDWQQGTAADVTRYEDYYDQKAKVAGVHWQVLEKDDPRFSYFVNQNADVSSIPTSKFNPDSVNITQKKAGGTKQFGTYDLSENGSTLQMYRGLPVNTYYIGFNMDKVPKPVRKAFAYVTDQQVITEQVFKGRGNPAYMFTPPNIYPGGGDAYTKHAKNDYPYGYNESQVDKAKQVMEDAGYGQNNTFTLQWTQYQSDTWTQVAQILQDSLRPAHIDMQTQQAPFSTLLQRGISGKLQVYTLGWIADWPEPDNFLQLLYPPNTLTSQSAPLSYLNWTKKNGSASGKATKAWKSVQNNEAPTDKAENARQKAYIQMENANWEDVGIIPLYNQYSDIFSYDWAEFEPFGAMGISREKFNTAKISSSQP